MTEIISPYVTIAFWFIACGAALIPLSRLYVRSLLALRKLRSIWKVTAGGVLWLGFAVIGVLPLLGGMALANRHFPVLLEFPSLLWLVACYLASCVPIFRNINSRREELQAAGFFQE